MIEAIGKNIICKIEKETTALESSIVVAPSTITDVDIMGIVHSIGDEVSEIGKSKIKIGDKIMWNKYCNPTTIVIKEQEFYIVSYDDVIAKI